MISFLDYLLAGWFNSTHVHVPDIHFPRLKIRNSWNRRKHGPHGPRTVHHLWISFSIKSQNSTKPTHALAPETLDTNICKQMEFSRILIWNLACHNFDNGGVSLHMKWEMCNHLNDWAMDNQSLQGNGHLNRWWGILKSRSINLPSRFLTGMEVVRQGERNAPRQGRFCYDWGSLCLIFST